MKEYMITKPNNSYKPWVQIQQQIFWELWKLNKVGSILRGVKLGARDQYGVSCLLWLYSEEDHRCSNTDVGWLKFW